MYELETQSGADLTNNVIPVVEDAFTAAILPLLLSDNCSGSVRRLRESGRRRLVATGVSSLPIDLVLEGIECDPDNVIDSANDCVTVSGELTVYIDGDEADVVATVNAVLENGMSNGDFLYADDTLVRITWDELFPVSVVEEPLATAAPTSAPTFDILDTTNLIYLLLGAIVVMLFVIACCFLCRGSNRQDRDPDQYAYVG